MSDHKPSSLREAPGAAMNSKLRGNEHRRNPTEVDTVASLGELGSPALWSLSSRLRDFSTIAEKAEKPENV